MKMRRYKRNGFGVIETLIGMGIILLAVVASFSCLIYISKAIIEIHARTEWRILNFHLDTILSDTLLCEKTSLVRAGDPNRYVADAAIGLPTSDWKPALYKEDVDAIEYYPDPAGSPIALVKVGEGRLFEVTNIKIGQFTPPAGGYNFLGVQKLDVPTEIVIEAAFRNAKGRGSPLTYIHRINFDVDATVAGVTYPAISCYAAQSRRHMCEQFIRDYDPGTAGTICKCRTLAAPLSPLPCP